MINFNNLLDNCNIIQLSKDCTEEKITIGVIIFDSRCVVIKSNISDTYCKSRIIMEIDLSIQRQKNELVDYLDKLLDNKYIIDLYK